MESLEDIMKADKEKLTTPINTVEVNGIIVITFTHSQNHTNTVTVSITDK